MLGWLASLEHVNSRPGYLGRYVAYRCPMTWCKHEMDSQRLPLDIGSAASGILNPVMDTRILMMPI
jgi:hypothetical protein